MSQAYDCITAEDVRHAAQRVRALRREWFAMKLSPVPTFMWSRWPSIYPPGVSFSSLVEAAYPRNYPQTFAIGSAPPKITEIIHCVCKAYNCRAEDLVSARRDERVVLIRHVCMALARYLTTKSLPEIGRHFGDRDHTTIMYAVRKLQPVIAAAEADVCAPAPLSVWVSSYKYHAERLNISARNYRRRTCQNGRAIK